MNNSIVLLILTHQPEASVHLIKDGNGIAEKKFKAGRDLGARLLEAIEEVCKKSNIKVPDITRFAVHRGPGNSSALRAGVTVANMLAQANGAEAVGIDAASLPNMITQATTLPATQPIQPIYPQFK